MCRKPCDAKDPARIAFVRKYYPNVQVCELEDIEKVYHIFENKLDGVIKVAIEP